MIRGPVYCAVGIGANLPSASGGPAETIGCAAQALAAHRAVASFRISSMYQTDPVGGKPQPRYTNAAAVFRTSLDAHELMDILLEIERSHGRVRTPESRWGPRPLDLDLLLYGDRVIRDERLSVPHPRMADRLFVLEPLAEIAPDMPVPGYGTVSGLLGALQRASCAAFSKE